MDRNADWEFVHSVAIKAIWTDGLRIIFDYRDVGLSAGTNGDYVAQIIKQNGNRQLDEVQNWHIHECTFQFLHVIKGWSKFEYEGVGIRTLRTGDCINQKPMIAHREIDDYEVLEIVAPANFKTRIVDVTTEASN